jgi:Tol biopolymer transport system component
MVLAAWAFAVQPAAAEDAVPAAPAEAAGQPGRPEPLMPLFVRPFAEAGKGRNDGNPVWSRSGLFLSFERSEGDKKEVRVHLSDGREVQTVYHQLSSGGGEMKFFFPGVVEDISYNASLTWAPDDMRFLFMSNGGAGNYDLYAADLGSVAFTRLTEHKEKDGQPDWSPRANAAVFVSGRTGKGDLYLMDLGTRGLTRLTQGGREHLYPQWSPDGGKIAFIAGSNENHDIFVIEPSKPPQHQLPPRQLTAWQHDDIRPVWSPDGGKVAFYSNYNAANDPRIWSIMVVNADGSDPAEGAGLAAKAVAMDVIPDVERGPAWMPDSGRIVYVKNDRLEYHPIYVVNVADKVSRPLQTETKMNHDVACSPDGTIAFRAQVDQWDRIFVTRIKE